MAHITDPSRAVLLLWIIFVIYVSCHVLLSVCFSLVVTCWESADLLALLYVMFYCVFVTFPCGVLGLVWCCQILIFASFLTLL